VDLLWGQVSILSPGILIAAPPLGDPNFDRSVVLLASHDDQGAFGWVINGERLLSVAQLLEQADITPSGEAHSATLGEAVSRGGPVACGQVWLVYPTAHELVGVDPQLEVAPGISATASRDFLQRLADGAAVPHLRAFAGYAGWAAGQLEAEIKQGAWLPGDVSPHLVFETDPMTLWQRAYEMQGVTPLAFTSRTIGSA
jgi:putative transcriptional regulator